MKWFNLSLLLVVIALGVVLVIEPAVITQLLPAQQVTATALPESVADIQTLDELEVPPALLTAKPRSVPRPVKPQPVIQGEAQTQQLKSVEFTAEQLDQPDNADQPATDNPRPGDSLPEDSAENEAAVDMEPAAGATTDCYRDGPLQDFDQVAAAGDLLVSGSMIDSWAEIEAPYIEQRFWVVLDESGSREQAREWIRKLDEKKFGDHYLPRDVGEPYLISLGIFKTTDRAERHLQALKAAEFPVKLRPKPVELSRRWVAFAAPPASETTLKTALAALSISSAEVEQCPPPSAETL